MHQNIKFLYNAYRWISIAKCGRQGMEIVKINEKSIKISLSSDEVKEYDLGEGKELDAEEMKRIFSSLLLKAKKEVGFTYAKENIVAEIFSSKDGGCEIFVSCLLDEVKMYKDKREELSSLKTKAQGQIYSFENIESLIVVLDALKNIDLSLRTSVYYNKNNGKYFLILENVLRKNLKYAFILEFAKHLKSPLLQYVTEYFSPICINNAHEVLPRLYH